MTNWPRFILHVIKSSWSVIIFDSSNWMEKSFNYVTHFGLWFNLKLMKYYDFIMMIILVFICINRYKRIANLYYVDDILFRKIPINNTNFVENGLWQSINTKWVNCLLSRRTPSNVIDILHLYLNFFVWKVWPTCIDIA